MSANDLDAPLRAKSRRRLIRIPFPYAGIAAAAAFGLALTAVTWVAVVDDPEGGQAVAIAHIEGDSPTTTGSVAAPKPAMQPQAQKSTNVENTALPGVAVTTRSFDPPRNAGSLGTSRIDSLVETTAFGPLPIIGPDGLRALDAYSRRSMVGPGDNVPRVAIVVGGLGISQTGTQRAIQTLPSDVTLAFAAHGGSLKRWLDMARREGHEALIQIPMEPFGYPQNDPGPKTLLANGDDLANSENLNWALGRLTGYVGIINHMGGRYSADFNAMQWLLTEIAGRGLMYVDNGSVPRSIAGEVGSAIGAPVVGANLVIDRVRTPTQVQKSLERLEETAKATGLAVGFASAFPTSVSAIAAWAESASDRGVVLVPITSALAR